MLLQNINNYYSQIIKFASIHPENFLLDIPYSRQYPGWVKESSPLK